MRVTERSAFFATLALYARIEESAQTKTAATDGRTIYVNRSFFEGLTAAEQEGLLLHEVLHAALLHLSRRGGRQPTLWNIAADIVINGMILSQGYALPSGGVIDRTLERLGSEEVYEKLLQRAEQQRPAGGESDLLAAPPSDASPQAQQAHQESGDQQALDGYWRQALEQAEIGAQSLLGGSTPAGLTREVGQVRGAQIDWRSYLWRYLTQTPTDFADFDRRFVGRSIYLDTLAGESVQVLVAVDTSGSINQGALEGFLGELRGVLHAYPHLRCDLYYADTELHGPYPVKEGVELPKPKGGGGTDFRPFFQQIASHPFQWGRTVAIYLTDGYGRFPEQAPACPVLWVVTPGGREVAKFPFGEVVRLLPAQMTPFVADFTDVAER